MLGLQAMGKLHYFDMVIEEVAISYRNCRLLMPMSKGYDPNNLDKMGARMVYMALYADASSWHYNSVKLKKWL